MRTAVAKWVCRVCLNVVNNVSFIRKISGIDILPEAPPFQLQMLPRSSATEVIVVTLLHDGQQTSWRLRTSTSTRTLYALANRATKARYSSFTLRLSRNKVTIRDSENITLGLTDISRGGVVEIARAVPHSRRLVEVELKDADGPLKIFLPKNAPTLSVLSYAHCSAVVTMSDALLW